MSYIYFFNFCATSLITGDKYIHIIRTQKRSAWVNPEINHGRELSKKLINGLKTKLINCQNFQKCEFSIYRLCSIFSIFRGLAKSTFVG